MAELTLYRDQSSDFTVISNLFIDQYMKDANDAQLKVYLYLTRMLNAGETTSVSDIADKFNHTETEVLRSLKYWAKQGVLSLEYDQGKTLTGIRMHSLHAAPQEQAAAQPELSALPAKSVPLRAEAVAPLRPTAQISLSEPFIAPQTTQLLPEIAGGGEAFDEAPDFTKPIYTPQQLREFKSRESTAQLLFVAEQYIGRPLTPAEMKTILFFTDVLHFSDDLIDYLLQYCVDRDKKDFKYIEKVAVNWAQEGITTPKEAQRGIGKYDKNVYIIMNELGKSGSPTSKEMEFINRWTGEYGFSLELILMACQRTVLSTDKHRFEYAEGILKSWNTANVRHKADVLRLDEQHQKKKSPVKSVAGSGNKFNQFPQNHYDFEELEKKLISNN